jgi:acyl-coenzyme A synthetase/AMP-(fatty) acid ligase|tara:strand:+ start:1502 stop:2857 length:1356 start_codon:yes stop_codon:yes gene_type:complete
MILRNSLEKIPNSQFLIISPKGKLSRDQIIHRYKKDIKHALKGARIVLCLSDPVVTLPILAALDGVVEAFVLISPTNTAESISSLAIRGGFEAILCEEPKIFKDIEGTPPAFQDLDTLADSFSPREISGETQWIMTTSGTTGRPKLVSHTLVSLIRTTKIETKRGASVRWGMLYDYTRFAGLQVLLQSVLSGSLLIVPPLEDQLNNKIKIFIEHDCTHLSATPTLWRKIVMMPNADKIRLRQATLGGEIADDRILSTISSFFPQARVVHIFASTEAGVGFSVADKRAGFPLDYLKNPSLGVDIKIKNDKLYIRNKHVHYKYFGSDVAFATKDGWVNTGDTVEIKGDRVLFRGREDGVINVGGDKVYPEEVERVLLIHPLVTAARVYAKSNPITGALVAAEVILTDSNANIKETHKVLQDYTLQMLDRHKVPAIITIVPRFSLNSAGKIVRK